MKVLKFGGSSVGSVENLHRIKQILTAQEGNFILVVSAFSGVTNLLQELAKQSLAGDYDEALEQLYNRHQEMNLGLGLEQDSELNNWIEHQFQDLESICSGISILNELTDKSTARIMAKGELMSSRIIQQFLEKNGISTEWKDSRNLIRTDSNYLNAQLDYEQTEKICLSKFNTQKNYILPGFIARNAEDQDTLLGRGGSDYTATIIGSIINASAIELWSDVNGLLNADPRIVKEAKPIHEMSYEEAFEMSYFGAKVIYPPAIKPAMRRNTPVLLKNTLNPTDEGTRIHQYADRRYDKVLGVSTLKEISLFDISGVGLAGIGSAKTVLSALADAGVNVILISQSCSEQSICIAVKSEDVPKAKATLNQAFEQEINSRLVNPIEAKGNQVILALVGDQMKSQVGLSGKVFSALGENNINVRAIAQGASERNISIVIDEKDAGKAVNVVHERFFQDVIKRVNLFIIGVGNVGKEFLTILQQQQEYCKTHYKVELRVAMLANSSTYQFNVDGLSNEQIQNFPSESNAYSNIEELTGQIVAANLPNSILVDNTASDVVAGIYAQLFQSSISVATCNKIASSSAYDNYHNLLELARQHNCSFKYETTVGASLPIIRTIQDMRLSGDSIQKIQAVLSGSLNFIFNNYDGSKPFVEIVKSAMEEGYTEPDPRIDLSGLDVKRKLLILARESGKTINMDDIGFKSFLPKSADKANSVDDFLQALQQEEPFFQNMLQDAQANDARLKVIAEMDGDQYSVSLKQVRADSPFYHLDGKDNIVAMNSLYYSSEPLIVKGAGAGAKVTASGVLADVMYVTNRSL